MYVVVLNTARICEFFVEHLCSGLWSGFISHLPLLTSPIFLPSTVSSVWQVPGMGAHGWVAGICQPWGQFFYLGAGWPQWKPLGIPGTHLPLKWCSWLNSYVHKLLKCSNSFKKIKKMDTHINTLSNKPFWETCAAVFPSYSHPTAA